MSGLNLPAETFGHVAAFLKERSGLTITKDKLYLLETRLQPVATLHDYPSVSSLLEALGLGKITRSVQNDIIEAMTTNESLFLRDIKPFEAFVKTMVPTLTQHGVQDIRVWCGACSTGQEPFSLMMRLAEERARLPNVSLRIDASDLAPKVIERAKEGVFTHFEVQRGLPVTYLLKYFTQLDTQRWQIKPEISNHVRFSVQNLLMPFAAGTQYHIVFCRYVLIYFDEATRVEMIHRLAGIIPQGGYLALGASETIRIEHHALFVPLDGIPGIYQRL